MSSATRTVLSSWISYTASKEVTTHPSCARADVATTSPQAASMTAGKAAANQRRISSAGRGLAPLVNRGVAPPSGPYVYLPRAGDALLRVFDHLPPLRQPPSRARDGEQHREHVDGEAQRLVDDAGVEVHVGIELPLDEVIVLKGDAFQFQGDLQEGVRPRQLEHLVRRALDDAGARVIDLVHTVAEAHQPLFARPHALHELRD